MEFIVAARYVFLKDAEVGSFPGVAYKLPDGKIRTELIWGTDPKAGVLLHGDKTEDGMFTVNHVFVERYVNQCLNRSLQDVEVFRFHFTRGDFPDQPTDVSGELVGHSINEKGEFIWFTYEHISGPYLADTQYLMSAFYAHRLDDISAEIIHNLVPDRLIYLQHPQDLPLVGVIPNGSETDQYQKQLEDLLFRTRKPKPQVIQ